MTHRSPYRLKEVDGDDDEVADILTTLHKVTFADTAALVPFDNGHWWLVYFGDEPVAFAGVTPSVLGPGVGYLKRAGVVHEHRGQGLQRRLLRAREMRARRNGWHRLVTDTSNDNVQSSNTLIKCGYRLFWPTHPWALSCSMYWKKDIA